MKGEDVQGEAGGRGSEEREVREMRKLKGAKGPDLEVIFWVAKRGTAKRMG